MVDVFGFFKKLLFSNNRWSHPSPRSFAFPTPVLYPVDPPPSPGPSHFPLQLFNLSSLDGEVCSLGGEEICQEAQKFPEPLVKTWSPRPAPLPCPTRSCWPTFIQNPLPPSCLQRWARRNTKPPSQAPSLTNWQIK